MKPFSLIFLVLFASLNGNAQTKKVAINVAVLGTKHPTVRYYHPINGLYTISSETVSYNKSELKGLERFTLIQPARLLHDSTNIIQANSLRHYVDPSELIYVEWKMGNDPSNYTRLDTFTAESQKIRDQKYAGLVQDYFNPFFISKYEVTNREYREFTEWVRDSIFLEAIYASDSITDEQAFEMLNKPAELYYNESSLEWIEVSPKDRFINREIYGLNQDYDYRKSLKDEVLFPIISKFYHEPNERFYKRREIDPRHFNYRYYSTDMKALANADFKEPVQKKQNSQIRSHRDLTPFIIDHNLNIYPDTTAWLYVNFNTFNQASTNMYFWHPAFDNMPVVGVSHEQAKAYCHWKQKQLQKSHPDLAWGWTIDLPNLIEYEWAVTAGHKQYIAAQIQDNNLVTDLCVGGKNETDLPENFAYDKSRMQKVYRPYDIENLKAHKKFLKLMKKIKPGVYTGVFGTKPEVIMRAQDNYLASGVEFLSNNASEWMCEDYNTHYNALFEAYINYKCFSDPTYCENQRNIDQNANRLNDTDGHLIIGANWYDERYGNYAGVNKAGLYPKTFKTDSSSYATVGFRLVVRMNPPISQN